MKIKVIINIFRLLIIPFPSTMDMQAPFSQARHQTRGYMRQKTWVKAILIALTFSYRAISPDHMVTPHDINDP